MNSILRIIPIVIISAYSQSLLSQHINIDKKALSFLASEETINTVFDFDGLVIDNDATESIFLEKMRIKIIRQRDENEADQWLKSYNEFKSQIWSTSFLEHFNARIIKFDNAPVFVENVQTTKYTMKINIPWMYFGFDAGILNAPAKVNMKIDFFETAAPGNILFSTTMKRAMGKYNKTDGDGEGAGPSLNRMRKAFIFAAFKLSQALKTVIN